jgi:membrane-bound lytic murein transglycosylase D
MKKTTLTLSLLLFCTIVFGQTPPPAPRSVGFGGMTVQFDDEARAIVQDDINALMVNKKYWEAKLDRCLMYLPIIETILIDEDIPTDFKFLAVQESSLQPDAASASNAVGFWQFKQETATDYGLRVDDQIDERKNINASTHAAAQYLKKNNLQFNNWVATLYSYYLGAGAIAKLIPADWSYSKEVKLTGTTDRYILRFFAHKIALETGLNRYTSPKPVILLEYTKGGGRTFGSVAKELDVEVESLRAFNKWTTGNDIPNDKPYTLVVPVSGFEAQNVKAKIGTDNGSGNRRDNFTQSDIGFPALKRSQAGDGIGALLYEINGLPGIMATNGDDAGSLARKAKMSFGSFLRYNDMSENDPIDPGQVYYLEKKAKKAVVPYHTVRDGETLWKISQIYGIRLRRLVRNNRIDNRNQRLQTGRVLWLMEKRPRDKPVEIVEGAPDELFPNRSRSQPRPAAPEPKPTDSGRNIPQKPADRKVYTPKLADKPKPAAPVQTPPQSKPNDMGEEITTQEVPQKQSQPKPTETEKPSRRAPSFNPSGSKSETGATSPKKSASQSSEVVQKQQEVATSPKKAVGQDSEVASQKSQEVVKKQEPEVKIQKTQISNSKPQISSPASFTHTITHGQTYYSISKMYEVSVNDILAWNTLTLDSKLADGQKLIIKTVGKTAEAQPQQPTDTNEFIIHTVDAGEWLFRIAQKYGVKMAQIREWNNLTDDAVKVGQQLKIKKK